ncbi:MAG: bifunctional DNA-formamidopyrimidine glycosylase/DNA-(apurinic or apyrimidinic site) lyase [Chloroflexota bacterium]
MPELPEVETTVRALREPLVGRVITGVRNDWPRHIATPTLEELQARIGGRRIEAIDRRGKYLVFRLDADETLLIHLKMTGHLSVVPSGTPPDKHTHTIFELAGGKWQVAGGEIQNPKSKIQNGELHFNDPRKFGRVYLVRDPAEVVGDLGPEPLEPEFTPAVLAERLRGHKKALKTLLLDQTFLAGVGNIYADEALFEARLHPLRPANSLSAAEIEALHAAIQYVLELGITREGASIDRYRKPDGEKGDMQNAVSVFRRTGYPCFRCGTPILRMVVGGRSTHFCPECQTR